MFTVFRPSYLKRILLRQEIDILREMGVEFKTGVEVGKDITLNQLREDGYEAFYIAIGCQGGRKINVPGEDADGVMTGVDFLHITTDDENYKLAGDTVVIGGGNVAIDVSRSAVRCDSANVYQVSLETRDIMPALPEEIELAESEGIKFHEGWGPKEILTENGKVTGDRIQKCTQVKNAEGRFDPLYDESDTMTIPCSNVILSVGQGTVWGIFLRMKLLSSEDRHLLRILLHTRQQWMISLSVETCLQDLDLLLMRSRRVRKRNIDPQICTAGIVTYDRT